MSVNNKHCSFWTWFRVGKPVFNMLLLDRDMHGTENMLFMNEINCSVISVAPFHSSWFPVSNFCSDFCHYEIRSKSRISWLDIANSRMLRLLRSGITQMAAGREGRKSDLLLPSSGCWKGSITFFQHPPQYLKKDVLYRLPAKNRIILSIWKERKHTYTQISAWLSSILNINYIYHQSTL